MDSTSVGESNIAPLAYKLRDGLRKLGLSPRTFYRMPESERPASYVVGRNRYISHAAAVAWLAKQEARCSGEGSRDDAA